MAPDNQGTVTETRDVTELESNEAVEEEVDDMLDISEEDRPDRELSDETESDEAQTEEDGGDEEEVRPEIQKQMEEAKAREEDGEGNTEVEVSAMADESEDWENFDFEDQDWDSIEKKEPEVIEVGGIKFLFKEPDEGDDVLNDLEGAANGDGAARMRGMIEIVVDKPDITEERWDRLTFAQKLELAGRSADFLGLDDDFLEG